MRAVNVDLKLYQNNKNILEEGGEIILPGDRKLVIVYPPTLYVDIKN